MNKTRVVRISAGIVVLLAIFGIVFGIIASRESVVPTSHSDTQVSGPSQRDQAADSERIPQPSISGDRIESPNLRVDHVRYNQAIASPLVLTGVARGWYFEGSFPITLYDAAGNQIASGIAQAQEDWMTDQFVAFRATLIFLPPAGSENGTIVFQKDNPSGLPEYDESVTVPVRFPREVREITVFFSAIPEGATTCDQTRAVKRLIPLDAHPIRGALDALIAGPTLEEERSGITPTINPDSGVQSMTLLGEGVLHIDFDDAFEKGVAGACRVESIRAQLNDTFLQFPGMKELALSVRGRFDDILQP